MTVTAVYRQTRNYENLHKALFEGVGDYGIPEIIPLDCEDVENWISFNFAKTCDEPEIHGLHFFVDDYQFERVWKTPDVYVPRLKQFQVVCTPDFSTYTDFPVAVQIFNHYKKHWLGAYWQLHGVKVIPTISWSDESSFAWCFDGEPVGGTVAVSSVGTQANSDYGDLFMRGYDAMLERIQPSKIIFYGKRPPECRGNVVEVAHFCKTKWRS